MLISYSHTRHLADLQLCVHAPHNSVGRADTSEIKRPWSLRDRLDERVRGELVDAYRAGATAASLASAHGLSLRSVKRLVAVAGVRRGKLSA